ncbi:MULTISPECIES: DUF1127 domain-containing protein [Sulfitobacter]|jgi:uncharacterized protein YjiS (DUF1127 family)|uniref:YjiS-like domain-containing protein n=1 Tax=Sulfitobacter dubius TaxID=218673 RepID=A0ABY3ZJX1_9RHOB|nr:DUF1127 domain-containing protein [Sulfitobacter dubius]UOA14069.1 hypothetical protein DSM109990_00866 [Sulfitobacter dubius]WOI30430.1 DUF1127 domain-containing protein [Sulfitobacter dubius]SFG59814.1 protein of unknown function [Sulfitobacter dubius]|tara:strand:- start:308 stop:550 length:243 start_codon:yes stop_codon:yes gene_type:complete
MTMAISRGTTLSSALDGLQHTFDGMRRRVAQIKARRAAYDRTFTELNVLSDRELSDIGIARCDIRRVASEELSKEQTYEV